MLAGEMGRDIEIMFQYDDLSPIPGAAYRVSFEDGAVREGTLDEQGYALLADVPGGKYVVEYGDDPQVWEAPAGQPRVNGRTSSAKISPAVQLTWQEPLD